METNIVLNNFLYISRYENTVYKNNRCQKRVFLKMQTHVPNTKNF